MSIMARRISPPQTGRIYDRTRSEDVAPSRFDNREESIYGLLGHSRVTDAPADEPWLVSLAAAVSAGATVDCDTLYYLSGSSPPAPTSCRR